MSADHWTTAGGNFITVQVNALSVCLGKGKWRVKELTENLGEAVSIVQVDRHDPLQNIINALLPGIVEPHMVRLFSPMVRLRHPSGPSHRQQLTGRATCMLGVHQVTLDEARKTAVVRMEPGETGQNKCNISRTIGRNASNVRLASAITGWAIQVEQPKDQEAAPRLFGGRGRGGDGSRGGRGRGGRRTGRPQMASSSPRPRRPWGSTVGGRGTDRETEPHGDRPKTLARTYTQPMMNEGWQTPEVSQEVSEEKREQLVEPNESYSGGVVSTPLDDSDAAASAAVESEPDDPVPTIPVWQGE
jgi:transcription antitermination factor NusA-like protein